MSPDEFRRAGHEAVDWIADYLAGVRDYPVLAPVAPGELTDRLPRQAPEEGEPVEQLLADFRRLILPAHTHWNHPRFMAYFSISGSPPGILGEMLAAALNSNHMLWRTSPAATELELVTMSWLRQWLGLPEEFFGIVYDTASISSLHGIAAARQLAAPRARTEGTPPGLVLYSSDQAHSSIEKAAITLGIGHRNVRRIRCDAEFRMPPAALEAAIRADLDRGLKPFCVVATVGTTATTSIDPVPEIAAIARRYGLWLHVDAAYGGVVALSESLRHLTAGIELADSLVFNPHKWMLVPVDFSAFYIRRPEVLREAFSLVAEYLRTDDNPRAVNLMDYGVQLGRRFRALKTWFVMRSYGRRGLARMVEQHCEWAQELVRWIEADPRFEVCAPVHFSLVCFRLKAGDGPTRALLEKINASGLALLSHAVLGGRFVLRLAIGNFQTTREDVRRVWEFLQAAAGEV